MRPINNRVIIRRQTSPEFIGSIYIPPKLRDDAKGEVMIGVVTHIGPGRTIQCPTCDGRGDLPAGAGECTTCLGTGWTKRRIPDLEVGGTVIFLKTIGEEIPTENEREPLLVTWDWACVAHLRTNEKGDTVLVPREKRAAIIREASKEVMGRFIIPEEYREKSRYGVVKSVGPDVEDVTVGSRVLLPPWGVVEATVEGQEYLLLDTGINGDIFGVDDSVSP